MNARPHFVGFWVVLACAACGPASASPPSEPNQAPPRSTMSSAGSAAKAPESGSEPVQRAKTPVEEASAPRELDRFGGTPFPPPDVKPPHERSQEPGDGVWRALGEPGEENPPQPLAMRITVLHPHKVSRWAKLTVAVMDQSRLKLHYVPGKSDVEDIAKLTREKLDGVQAGLVPEDELDHLFVVFNGGFKPRHGRWGMKSEGRVLLPAREDGCVVAVDARATVVIRDWGSLRDGAADFPHFRQTPPCLLEAGKLHPKLEAFNERPWGGFDPKRQTRRRSALGVDRSGRWLFYAIGEEMGPRVLAQGMSYVGAEFAAELDINWSWTRFLLYGRSSSETHPRVTSTLIPKMVHHDREYVKKLAARGFFYVTGR